MFSFGSGAIHGKMLLLTTCLDLFIENNGKVVFFPMSVFPIPGVLTLQIFLIFLVKFISVFIDMRRFIRHNLLKF